MSRFELIRSNASDETVQELQSASGLSEITARALALRGISDAEGAAAYLHPKRACLHDPMLLPDMDRAVARIRKAIVEHEQICIYGDYDADGVCASAILYKQLTRMGAEVGCFVPSRHTDGYGMHDHTVAELCESGADLIVTVDNGIAANEEIALCAEYGVDVIVTDHHIAGETLPECVAIVAASRKDSQYPYPWLCGAGVALKLAAALSDDGSADDELLGLAAVATMADVVQLTGENRALVQLGLPYITKNAGLAALLHSASTDAQPPDAAALAFVIAPRLNAAGRMGDASRAIVLLTENDPANAARIADELQRDNMRRREDEAAVLFDIYSMCPEEELKKRRGIVLRGHDWNIGVLGIVASRLCEKFSCPVLLFTEHQDALTGSGRSTDRIHLYDSLLPFAARFSRFGGHARAVGVTIAPEAFDAFAREYEASLQERFDASYFEPVYRYEQEIPIKAVTPKLVDELARLAPFGEGNPEPAFLLQNVALQQLRTIGKDGMHLSAVAAQGKASLRAVGFRMGTLAGENPGPIRGDLLCTLQNNTFRGETRAELRLIAVAPAKSAQPAQNKINGANVLELLYNAEGTYDKLCVLFSECAKDGQILPQNTGKEPMRTVYRALLGRFSGESAAQIAVSLSATELWALCVFTELGFFRCDQRSGRIEAVAGCAARELDESTVYRAVTSVKTNVGGTMT